MKIRITKKAQKALDEARQSIEKSIREARVECQTAATRSQALDTESLRFEAVSEVDPAFTGEELSLIFHEFAAAGLVKFRLHLDDARRLHSGLEASLERHDRLRGAN